MLGYYQFLLAFVTPTLLYLSQRFTRTDILWLFPWLPTGRSQNLSEHSKHLLDNVLVTL